MRLTADGDIKTGNIGADTYGEESQGNAGNITLESATGAIDTSIGYLSSWAGRTAGSVTLPASIGKY